MNARLLSRLACFALALSLLDCSKGPASKTLAGKSFNVTLVTGDRVHLSVLPDGRYAATVTSAGRAGKPAPAFAIYEIDGHAHVIPDDVAEDVSLDPALFDVTEMVEEGFDDAATSSLPLIIGYSPSGDGAASSALAAGWPGVESVRELSSIHAAAVAVTKSRVGEFRQALAVRPDLFGVALPADGSGDADFAGAGRIWLDRRVHASLQDSVPQIGAPAAWRLGFDGASVSVAVLDTGIDDSHPDLSGKIVAAQNFTDAADALDHFGHGTHVASTVAGTGAASGGLRKGVAPGATLLNGKVLNDQGAGLLSWIITGMQWAAVEQRARIINMSLGGGPSDGTDPLSRALSNLTRQTGALFVVAAGNYGRDRSVSTPGAADGALTVGAVDKSDTLAAFSSRGPRLGDLAIKPDITAPGVDIIAARAAGTSLGDPVDAHYTSLSGTSMATPHVAGACALLLEAHPDWTGQTLKAALVSTAVPNAVNTVYQQGGGRVDVQRAFAAGAIAASAPLDFGFFSWPHDQRQPIGRAVAYLNLGDAPLTLALSLDVRDGDGVQAPAGMLTLAQQQITLPPHGTASIGVALDTRLGNPDLYGGYLVAVPAAGQPALHVPVGFYKEPETHLLTVQGIARNAAPARFPSRVIVSNVDHTRFFTPQSLNFIASRGGKTRSIRVPVGTYSAAGVIFTRATPELPFFDFTNNTDLTLVANPQFSVSQDMTLLLDARGSTEVAITTPDRETKRNPGAAVAVGYQRTDVHDKGYAFRYVLGDQLIDNRIFARQTQPVTKGAFEAYTRWQLEAPDIRMQLGSEDALTLHPEYVYRTAWPEAGSADRNVSIPRLDGEIELPLVDANLGRAQDFVGLDVRGKIALMQWDDGLSFWDQVFVQSKNAAAAGAAMAIIYSNGPGPRRPVDLVIPHFTIPTLRLSRDEGQQLAQLLAAGPVTVEARGIANSPYLYDLVFPEQGAIPPSLDYVAADEQLAQLENIFYAHKPGRALGEARSFFRPRERFSGSILRDVREVPRKRTELVSAGDTVWHQDLWADFPWANLTEDLNSYVAGEARVQRWWKQPLRPGFVEGTQFGPPIPVSRTKDVLLVVIPQFEDANRHIGAQFPIPTRTVFRLYQDGQLIHTEPNIPNSFIRLVPEPARYRLELDVDNNPHLEPSPFGPGFPSTLYNDWATLSTTTHTAWTFDSARPADSATQVLPLMQIDYDLGNLDLLNRVPAEGERASHTIIIHPRHQAGAESVPVEHVELAISQDDGDTWEETRVTRVEKDAFQVRIKRGADPARGFVSLRVQATDLQGNGIRQEIIRAFAWRAPVPDDGGDQLRSTATARAGP